MDQKRGVVLPVFRHYDKCIYLMGQCDTFVHFFANMLHFGGGGGGGGLPPRPPPPPPIPHPLKQHPGGGGDGYGVYERGPPSMYVQPTHCCISNWSPLMEGGGLDEPKLQQALSTTRYLCTGFAGRCFLLCSCFAVPKVCVCVGGGGGAVLCLSRRPCVCGEVVAPCAQ